MTSLGAPPPNLPGHQPEGIGALVDVVEPDQCQLGPRAHVFENELDQHGRQGIGAVAPHQLAR